MTTLLITQPEDFRHDTPAGHPENPRRMEAVRAALDAPAFSALTREVAAPADESEALRCHPARYLDRLRAALPEAGTHALDADTHVSPGSLDTALAGVGAATRAVDAVLAGAAGNAFCAIRPPGHHAEAEKPMGFCLLGNAAIAAKRALDHHGLDRVAVVDFDVHHGNGTQALLWDEPRARFVSSHQMPLWPGTGAPEERGAHDTILNLPLEPGAGGAQFRALWEREALPMLERFAPELVIISAGFDAHRADPLAQLELGLEDFTWITGRLCDLADAHCAGRVVSLLEGGYDLDTLAACVAAHVESLMERSR